MTVLYALCLLLGLGAMGGVTAMAYAMVDSLNANAQTQVDDTAQAAARYFVTVKAAEQQVAKDKEASEQPPAATEPAEPSETPGDTGETETPSEEPGETAARPATGEPGLWD